MAAIIVFKASKFYPPLEKVNYSIEEKKLAEKLCSLLSADFDIYSEQEIMKSPGKFLLDGKIHNSIPDLIIRPKKHLISSDSFIETIIPIEIKKFTVLETNKFEDLMFQCHSYRFSTFNDLHPKLCLYFIDDFFEHKEANTHLKYDYEASKDSRTSDFQIRNYMADKKKIETLFGRFGIGEIITNENGYCFRLKRQVLFQKRHDETIFKPQTLNYWWGTSRNPKRV